MGRGRLAPMAAELVDRFPGMGAADSRSLPSNSYARMHHFVGFFFLLAPFHSMLSTAFSCYYSTSTVKGYCRVYRYLYNARNYYTRRMSFCLYLFICT
jgi:hypothetical protein